MEVRLKVLVGKNAGQELLIPGPKFFIGRAEDCQLRPRSDLISRHHCALLIEDGFVAIRDFGSKNGTLVNGERVAGERELHSGDNLVVGPLEFEVYLGTNVGAGAGGVGSKKRPKVESVREAAARTAEGSNDGMDVSQWLTAKDQQDGAADTRIIDVNETGEIDMAAPKAVAAPETNGGGDAKKPFEKRAPGKLPVAPASASGDSRSAASDVLNKFFKRR